MSDERKPTQAMPSDSGSETEPRPTQPTAGHPRRRPKVDDEGFGGVMGHGGQTDFAYEGPTEDDGDGENPDAAADTD